MHKFKSHFWYNKNQRNGVFFLAIIIIILQLIYFFADFSSDDQIDEDSSDLIRFQEEIDSLKALKIENNQERIFPFNPSFISDFKGYQLGMSIEEIDRLLAHRASGKYINSVEEFQEVTSVSDSLLDVISPHFKFPDWVLNKQAQASKKSAILKTSEVKRTYTIKDINSASEQDLIAINGIGNKLAQRIVNYRNKLNGFIVNDQLYEVYYLDSEIADRVLEQYAVIEKPIIEKININEASFKQLLSIVYIDYDLTKKIFEYKDEVAEIQTLEELKKIDGFPLDKFDRIALYLEVK